ncbi:unnamed protein product [Cylicocyclus nassatus]|uniref:Uncharacterized protein n=1 Tax=Cylicocyclus nassatus TaxID=53992 RepID=A0AA36DUP0_CYLNA|nr:unnamed protein product [Cylicocyclus nassatus]
MVHYLQRSNATLVRWYEKFFVGSFLNSTSTITVYLAYMYCGIFFAILIFCISMVILWRQADKWKKYTDHICAGYHYYSGRSRVPAKSRRSRRSRGSRSRHSSRSGRSRRSSRRSGRSGRSHRSSRSRRSRRSSHSSRR